MRALRLGLLALAFAPATAIAQANAPDLSDPIALFNSVCLADKVALPRDAVVEQRYDALPQGTRDALGFANPPHGVPRIQPRPALTAAEVPNRIFAVLPNRTSYLLLPAERGQYAGACAVVWKGNHYTDALKAATGLALDQPLPGAPPLSTPIAGLNYVALQSKGMIVGAAEWSGWTVLRIAPDTSPQDSPAQ